MPHKKPDKPAAPKKKPATIPAKNHPRSSRTGRSVRNSGTESTGPKVTKKK